MGLFDELENRCEEIAGKVGIPPEQVQSLRASLEAKIAQQGMGHIEALEAVAREHGLPVDKIQELLSHCGGGQDILGSLGGLSGLAGNMFKR